MYLKGHELVMVMLLRLIVGYNNSLRRELRWGVGGARRYDITK